MLPKRAWMWDGQRAFHSLAQADARELFGRLDARLEPRVLLIGIRRTDRPELPEVCLEPEASDYAPETFLGLRTFMDKLAAADEALFFIANPHLSVDRRYQVVHMSLQKTLQALLAPLGETAGSVSFCSFPQRVDAYMVTVVLLFEEEAYRAHALPIEAADEEDEVLGSLVHATVDEFLVECSLALASPERGRYGVMRRDVKELLRAAGAKLMVAPGFRMQGMLDLYDVCNTVSSLHYEGSESIGGLLLAPHHHERVKLELAFRHPVSLRDFRTVRKLLEMSSSELFLLCAEGSVYGLGSCEPCERLFLVSILGHLHWRLLYAGRVLMEVSYGQPHLPEERIDQTRFRQEMRRIFRELQAAALEALWELVLEATRQAHGTMVVISAGAAAEAARLSKHGLAVEPTPLTRELVRLVTAIDGAVLIDPMNVCYAVGVILDGRASDKGDPSRGARFNSAIRYVASSQYPCLAIVVSEDGMIDVVSGT